MANLRSICVYCGASPGTGDRFVEATEAFGAAMAQHGIRLVYGGGNVGLMGAVARAVLASGGEVTGIIPGFLKDREMLLAEAQEVIVVPDMHTRKRAMFDRADAFVALPGGVGTLEELVEQLTWAQLGHHQKPILLYDVDDFWDPLLALFEHMGRAGFLRDGFHQRILRANNPDAALAAMERAVAAVSPSVLAGDTARL